MTPSNKFFDLADGITDELNGGSVLCPVCGCCSLKQTPQYSPSVFTQAEMILKGERWTLKEEDMVWVCAGGCTKTERHNPKTKD
jgi:hypothetical protein